MAATRFYFVKVGETKPCLVEAGSQDAATRAAVQHLGLEVHVAKAGEVVELMRAGIEPIMAGAAAQGELID